MPAPWDGEHGTQAKWPAPSSERWGGTRVINQKMPARRLRITVLRLGRRNPSTPSQVSPQPDGLNPEAVRAIRSLHDGL